ncbi:sigma-70 family RNA polymerase sigma factor [Streptomyces hygroscopicus]|uniref:sigma-70 family RNA polymerase sigma factor n=1 Tax=Streptomyces hygroscopicus TaxID=1912 RepID=UPI00223F545F|nr:sigma-70 family RNA polymerase sigma factor [Streptomyces hygroscopicus]
MSWNVIGSTGAEEREQALFAECSEHVPALLAYVCRMLGGDRHRAEDIVQETLLRCWRKYNSGEEMLRPWLFTVARNLVIDGHRKKLVRPQEVDGAAWLEQEACELDHIERMLSAVVVSEALKALSPIHQGVLHETYYLGRTVEEAAKALGIPVGTVKSRIFYALRSLRLALQERGAIPVGSDVATAHTMRHRPSSSA